MTERNIDRLTLLSTFRAVLHEGSLVGAAEARGLTQSAVSKHLAKLRNWLGDPLFVRTREGMSPTDRALAMAPSAERILSEADRLGELTPFAPEALTGPFVIATTDEVRARLLDGLAAKIADIAPRLRLSFIPLEPDYSLDRLEAGRVDLVVSVNWHAPDRLIQKKLFSDQFVCLMSRSHKLAARSLTLKGYAKAPHVMVAPLGMARGFIDDVLDRHNLTRFVRLSVPDFASVDAGLLGDDALVTLPKRVATLAAAREELVIRALPFDTPPIDYYAFWHKRFAHDQANVWMRGLVADILSYEAPKAKSVKKAEA